MPTPAELALDYDELRRYKKVSGALTHRLGGKKRKQLRKEKAGFEGRIKDPNRVTGTVNAPKLAQESENAGNLRYGQPIRESEQMSANIPNWYDAWKADIAKAGQSTTQAWQGALDATRATQTQLGNQDNQRAQAADAEAQKSAQLRGATAGPNVAAQAQAARNAQATNFTSFLGGQGAAQTGFLNTRMANVEPQKMASLEREGKRRAEMQKERGDYVSQYIAQARDKERTYGLERAAFGLDQQKAAYDALDDRADRRNKNRGLDIQEGSLTERQRHNLAMENKSGAGKKPTKGVGSLTQGQENRIVGKVQGAQSWIRKLRKIRGENGQPIPESEIRSMLTTGGKVGPDGAKVTIPAFEKAWVNAAYDLEVNGYLSRPNIKALHDQGIHIPKSWQKKPTAIKKPVKGKGKIRRG